MNGRLQEFTADMALVFSNCFRYNKPESPVASICRNIERLYHELSVSKGLQKWLEREDIVEAWYASRRGFVDCPEDPKPEQFEEAGQLTTKIELNGK